METNTSRMIYLDGSNYQLWISRMEDLLYVNGLPMKLSPNPGLLTWQAGRSTYNNNRFASFDPKGRLGSIYNNSIFASLDSKGRFWLWRNPSKKTDP